MKVELTELTNQFVRHLSALLTKDLRFERREDSHRPKPKALCLSCACRMNR